MDGSGVVFGVIVAIWAACLLPQWLQRRDELSGSRAGDRFSEGVRVLSRRVGAVAGAATGSPTEGASSSTRVASKSTSAVMTAGSTEPHPRLVATPVVRVPRPMALPAPTPTVTARAERPRSAAALAAARRRHILMTLVVLAVAGLAVSPMPTVPTWVGAVGAVPLLGFVTLLVATAPVRRRQGARPTARHAAPAPEAAATRRVVDLRDGAEPRAFDEAADAPAEVDQTLDVSALDVSALDVSALDVSALDLAAAAGNSTDPSLWQPIPVPRPTYTMKPAARRSTVQPYRAPAEVLVPRGAGVDRDRTGLDDALDRRRASGQ